MPEVITKNGGVLQDPLEQFEVMYAYYFCLFFTNVHYFAIALCAALTLFLLYTGSFVGYKNYKPNLVLFRDKTFTFISYLIKENLNVKIILFFPVIYLTFLFVLGANLLGMVPYSFTITSSAAVAFFLSVTFFLGITATGYGMHADSFFQILLPAGVPLVIAPFLIIIEAVSYIARAFSLAVRLFANMLAGHGLLKILASFISALFLHVPYGVPLYAFFPTMTVVLLVTLLELVVAFLQAYVFIVLVLVYLNDAVCMH
jgi:ATP synthase subunit 6